MHKPLVCVLATVGLVSPAFAQKPAVGWRSVAFENPSDQGSKRLKAIVYYPAVPGAKRSRRAPMAASEKPRPTIVFLHGFGVPVGAMVPIGRHFAARGYVLLLTNTTSVDRNLQAINGRAFFAALKRENGRKGSLLEGRIDLARVGISGHSMGGGNSARVLSDNPGYKAGFCFAPWTTRTRSVKDYVGRFAKTIKVPLAIIHGVKDQVLPWRANAQRLFDAVAKDTTQKIFWVLDDSANHSNIAIPALVGRPSKTNKRVFLMCAGLATAFFDHHLKGEPDALAACLDENGEKPRGVKQVLVNGQPVKVQPSTVQPGKHQPRKHQPRKHQPGK